jgi:hypothetical protein
MLPSAVQTAHGKQHTASWGSSLLCMLVSWLHLTAAAVAAAAATAAAAAAAAAVVLLQVTRTMRLLTSEPSVLPAIKESGAIGQLVRRCAAAC